MELTAQVWLQAIFNGIALGWLYILMSLGLSLILGITGILQLAHGEVYMIGAYIVFYLCVSFGLNLYLAISISIIVMAVFGIFLERFVFRPVKGQILAPITISLGLTLILTNTAAISFGQVQQSIPRLAEGSFNILGAAIPKDRVVAMLFSAALLLLLYFFLKKFKFGQAMVASAQNWEAALLRGISANQMSAMAMAIGCALAAAAGALAGSILVLDPYMGSLPLVKGLVIIVLGGMGSLLGATIGGLILGLIDGVFPVIFNPATAALAPLIIVIIILLTRPQGLFGHE